jgi:hypothetical protein
MNKFDNGIHEKLCASMQLILALKLCYIDNTIEVNEKAM